VEIVVPTDVSDEQRAKLEELAALAPTAEVRAHLGVS
jgi:hypothetical protein